MLKYFYFLCISLILINSQLLFLEGDENDIPLYLSIEVITSQYRNQIYTFVEHGMRHIYDRHGNEEVKADAMDLVDKSGKNLHEPNSWHVTCLYIGKDLSKLDLPIYKHFSENEPVIVKLHTIVYIPGKIMASPVFPAYKDIENKIPHVTLFAGTYSPNDSNALLEAIFIDNPVYKRYYDSGDLKRDGFQINDELRNVEITLRNGRKEIVDKVYILKFNEWFFMYGRAKKIFPKSK
jgi:hypothetical protein